jgi:hypothetical protein
VRVNVKATVVSFVSGAHAEVDHIELRVIGLLVYVHKHVRWFYISVNEPCLVKVFKHVYRLLHYVHKKNRFV